MNTIASKTDWKLKQFYYVTQVSGLVVVFLIALALLSVPAGLTFLGDPQIIFFACVIIFCLHGSLFYLQERFQKKIYYTISRYAWLTFFLSIVYASGGIHSQIIFLLMFPLLASVVDLDDRATKMVGILSTLVFVSFIFFDTLGGLTSA